MLPERFVHLDSSAEKAIMESKNVFDFLNVETDSSLLSHIKLLINNNLNEVKKEFEDLVKDHGTSNDLKSISGHDYKEIFIREKLVLGKIILDKTNEIEEMKKVNLELESIINESKAITNMERSQENPKILSLLKIIEVSK